MDRLAALVRQVRITPVDGTAQDGDGVLRQVSIDPVSLAYLGTSDALYYPVTRETDPGVRAWVEDGDALPLLRLVSENVAAGFSGSPGSPPQENSNGLYLAVSCQDYPQIYNMTSPREERIAQRAASFLQMSAANPELYAPFTLEEYDRMPLDYSLLDQCLAWPAPAPAYPPDRPVPPQAKFTEAPVLVLNGDMDTLTPALEGRNTVTEYDHARQVVVYNTFHVSAIGDEDNCAQALVRRFIADLSPGDVTCAAHIAEVRLVPRFATAAAQLDPPRALSGNEGTATDLRVAAAAAYALGDVLDLYWANYTGQGVGLRGGTWNYVSNQAGSEYLFTMNGVRWTEDVAVSGQFTWSYYKPGAVRGKIVVTGPEGESGELTVHFDSREPDAQASLAGQIGGRKILATMYAP
jgi:pimeloyl-ACP methyl ester carboxylesterase